MPLVEFANKVVMSGGFGDGSDTKYVNLSLASRRPV